MESRPDGAFVEQAIILLDRRDMGLEEKLAAMWTLCELTRQFELGELPKQ
jgi:hypothetical protein